MYFTEILGLLFEKREKKQIGQEEEVQRGRNFLIEYAERIRGAPKGFVLRSAEKARLKKWPIFTHLSKPSFAKGEWIQEPSSHIKSGLTTCWQNRQIHLKAMEKRHVVLKE